MTSTSADAQPPESELQFDGLFPQWTPFGVDLPDPNAKPDCDPDNPMTQFIPQCQ